MESNIKNVKILFSDSSDNENTCYEKVYWEVLKVASSFPPQIKGIEVFLCQNISLSLHPMLAFTLVLTDKCEAVI